MRIVMKKLLIVSLALLCGSLAWLHAQERGPLKVVIAAGQGKDQLLKYKAYLEQNFDVQVNVLEMESAKQDPKTKKHIETPCKGIEALADCDVIVSNLYRTWAPADQLDILKKYYRSKPVVGLRKAHHGFQNWLDADKEVFGVRYRGHYFGKNVTITLVDKHRDHPIFKGFKPFLPGGGLYQHTELAPDIEVYMTGGPEDQPAAPQVWSRVVKEEDNRRVFYTRYDPSDLVKDAGVRDMVTRAIYWAAGREAAPAKR